jgi:hypothetical protein
MPTSISMRGMSISLNLKLNSAAFILGIFFAAGPAGAMPGVNFSYMGNGDAGILKFMRGNYMSSEAAIANYLKLHLENGLETGQVIDKPYLVRRGANCIDGTPVVCEFEGVVDERFSGIPKENAARAHRISKIKARIVLSHSAKIAVVKEESYPDLAKP